MPFMLTADGIVLDQYGMVELAENLLPVEYKGRKIDHKTTIVFERFYTSEIIEVEASDSGLLQALTLWLCTGFAYYDCGTLYLKSSKPVEEQINEIFEFHRRCYGPFDRDRLEPYMVPIFLEDDHDVVPFIYGIVDEIDLEEQDEE